MVEVSFASMWIFRMSRGMYLFLIQMYLCFYQINRWTWLTCYSMLSCWTQSMQRMQRFCSNLHVSISVFVCPCVSVHVCTEPAWTQQIAWYELYYQKFFQKCHLFSCQHVPTYTSCVHLRTLPRPPDPNGHRARWWSNVLQDAWASGTRTES